MLSLRELTRSQRVQRAVGLVAAHYLRLVWFTTRFNIEPVDAYERIPKHAPIILQIGPVRLEIGRGADQTTLSKVLLALAETPWAAGR